MSDNILLQLTNSKNRTVYTAIQQDNFINIKHECGGGYAYKYTDLFLGAECTLMDNQSSKVTGTYANEFIAYCKASGYLPVNILNKLN